MININHIQETIQKIISSKKLWFSSVISRYGMRSDKNIEEDDQNYDKEKMFVSDIRDVKFDVTSSVKNFLENNEHGRFFQAVCDLVFYKSVFAEAIFEIVQNDWDKTNFYQSAINYKMTLLMMKINSFVDGFYMEGLTNYENAIGLETPVEATLQNKVIYKGPIKYFPMRLEKGFDDQFPEYAGLLGEVQKNSNDLRLAHAHLKNKKLNEIIVKYGDNPEKLITELNRL